MLPAQAKVEAVLLYHFTMLLNFTGRVDVKFHKGKVGKEMKKKDKRNQVIMHSKQ